MSEFTVKDIQDVFDTQPRQELVPTASEVLFGFTLALARSAYPMEVIAAITTDASSITKEQVDARTGAKV